MWRYLNLGRLVPRPRGPPHAVYSPGMTRISSRGTMTQDTPSDDAGVMPPAIPRSIPMTTRLSALTTTPHVGDAHYGALAYAAGTLIQVGTRTTPYVSTLDLAARVDLEGRPL